MKDPKGIHKISSSSFSIIMVFIALSLVGLVLIPKLNILLTPSRTLPTIKVYFLCPNASARIIEQEVTSKLEGAFNSISGIENISSVSKKGNGEIKIECTKNVNLERTRFEIATIIRRIYPKLPSYVSYPTISISTKGGEKQQLLTYTLSAPLSQTQIQQYANKQIINKISIINGVSDIEIFGSNSYEWIVTCDYNLMEQLKINFNNISSSINNYFKTKIIGITEVAVSNDIQELTILLRSKNEHLDWSLIPIKKIDNRIIYLTDIASVSYKEKLPSSYYRVNGLNTINMVIYTQSGENSIKVSKRLFEYIDLNIEPILLKDYNLKLTYNASNYINKELKKIGFRSLFSLLSLLVFIIILTRQFRYLLIITLGLIINILMSVVFYQILKLEIHIYSLIGITVSFGIIIDNTIIMIDHYRYNKDRKIFLAILAATLTTIGAISIIYLLKDEQKINLIDFVSVILINLSISLFVSLFFIPSILDYLPINQRYTNSFYIRKRRIIRFNYLYEKQIFIFSKYNWVILFLFVLLFGIPIHLLPRKIEDQSSIANLYNKTIGADKFASNYRPLFEKILGGTFRIFSEKINETTIFSEPERTKLFIYGSMTEGCTVHQLNEANKIIERYLTQFNEIEIFETSVTSYKNSVLSIFFKPEAEKSSFPNTLKYKLQNVIVDIGGVDWNIFGVGNAFSNSSNSNPLSNHIILEGYGYDKLYTYAKALRDSLVRNRRINNVLISGNISWINKVGTELNLNFFTESLASYNIYLNDISNYIKMISTSNYIGEVYDGEKKTSIRLISNKNKDFNTWSLENNPILVDSIPIKLGFFGQIEKKASGNNIYKNNQQYRLIVSFDFSGPIKLANSISQESIEQLKPSFPIGYKAFIYKLSIWDKNDKKQYLLILLVIIVIYIICSILLESLTQPLAVITLIPVSFIGVFLTFILFNFEFDQGGFASFIFLGGIVVNSGLFIINDYNNYLQSKKNINNITNYIKAFNHKISPILLTIVSTIFGLIPFIWNNHKEVFWFSFAVGVIGGLLFSLIALYIFLPILLKVSK
jgi:multidrug efflux pump subunit AcrB